MATSARHQRQKLNLLKFRRSALGTPRPIVRLPESPLKSIGIVSLGVIVGFGVPTVVASQQHSPSKTSSQENSSNVTIETTTSSSTGEVFSSSDEPQAKASEPGSATVKINGEAVPLENGSVTRTYTDSFSGNVDVSVTIDHSSHSSSSTSSSTSTNISIDSSSASSDGSSQYPTRGSPRR